MTFDLDQGPRRTCADDCHADAGGRRVPLLCPPSCGCRCHRPDIPDPCDVRGQRRAHVITDPGELLGIMAERTRLGLDDRPAPPYRPGGPESQSPAPAVPSPAAGPDRPPGAASAAPAGTRGGASDAGSCGIAAVPLARRRSRAGKSAALRGALAALS